MCICVATRTKHTHILYAVFPSEFRPPILYMVDLKMLLATTYLALMTAFLKHLLPKFKPTWVFKLCRIRKRLPSPFPHFLLIIRKVFLPFLDFPPCFAHFQRVFTFRPLIVTSRERTG